MAAPVEFRHFTPTDSRQDLIRKVEQAPREHAEAVLAAYELLEQLHDKNVIQLLTGLLAAKDTVINHLTSLIASPEAVSALRIVLMLANTLKNVDPEKIHAALNAAGEKPPSLFGLAKQASSEEARRGMATGLALLRVLGESLEKK